MQNNSIFESISCCFLSKPKQKKNNQCVIHAGSPLIPQRSLLGCSSSRNKYMCLSQGLTSLRSTLRGKAWSKHREPPEVCCYHDGTGSTARAQGVTICHSLSSTCNLWAGGALSGIGPPLLTGLHLPARDKLDGLKKVFCAYCASGIVLRASQGLSHLIFTITLWGRYYYYLCFVDVETEAQEINLPKVPLLVNCRPWIKPCSQNLRSTMSLFLEAVSSPTGPQRNSANLLCHDSSLQEPETSTLLIPLPNH